MITTFCGAHNHGVFPDHVRFMRALQKIPLSVRKQLEINDDAGIPIKKNVHAMFHQSGGSVRPTEVMG